MRTILLIALASCYSPNESTWSGGVVSSSRLDSSALHDNRDQLAKIALGPLVLGRTDQGGMLANPSVHSMLEDPAARSLLSIVLACALPSNTIITARLGGGEFLFVGQTGLAIQWLFSPLSGPARGWVSACVLARLDASDLATPISMRGDHVSLQADHIERQVFTIEEGGFFGDVFSGVMAACYTAELTRPERLCARQDPDRTGLTLCGYTYAGSCSDACDRTDHLRCRVDGRFFDEVVATYLID